MRMLQSLGDLIELLGLLLELIREVSEFFLALGILSPVRGFHDCRATEKLIP